MERPFFRWTNGKQSSNLEKSPQTCIQCFLEHPRNLGQPRCQTRFGKRSLKMIIDRLLDTREKMLGNHLGTRIVTSNISTQRTLPILDSGDDLRRTCTLNLKNAHDNVLCSQHLHKHFQVHHSLGNKQCKKQTTTTLYCRIATSEQMYHAPNLRMNPQSDAESCEGNDVPSCLVQSMRFFGVRM